MDARDKRGHDESEWVTVVSDGHPPMRQMIMVGFLQAQNCTNLASSWRHPASRTDSWSPDFYRHIGRVLEEGKFHLGFFDDRLSMPDMYGRNTNGRQIPQWKSRRH